jgi:xanthine dehydrogenase YagR molybdenum-binding subunit
MSAPKPPTREQTLSLGIVGQALSQVTRSVPEDEPPPLPTNADLKVIGKPIDRLDAVQKVTGRARFTFDVQLPGMLYARRVVSSVAHARVTNVDTSEAEKYPGVRAVHVLTQPLMQQARLRDAKAEATRYPTIRYFGQPVAAVAADSQRAADAAALLV